MIELQARSPLAGLVPLGIGECRLSEAELGHLTALAPYKGQGKALSRALKAAHGLAAPAPGRANGREGARVLWFGRKTVLLAGPAPDAALAGCAALTDQTDAWAAARLEGRDAAAVLARLTPIDLRAGVFKRGHTARTELRHMPASITRLGEAAFLILVFRSFARTLVHELRDAMESVAARAQG